MRVQHRRGFLLGAVIALAAVLIIGVWFLFSSTLEQGRQTLLTRDGLQARCLAEMALNRALRVFQERLNDPAVFGPSGSADHPVVRLRLPLPVADAATGRLNVAELPEFVFTRADLIASETASGAPNLDSLFAFMMDGRQGSYSVRVTAKVEEAWRVVGDGPQTPPVPGVDLPWNIRQDVREFLEGKGYLSFFLRFPSDMVLFDFTIPIRAFGFDLFHIDICELVDAALKTLINGLGGGFRQQLDEFLPEAEGGTRGYLRTLTTLDVLARILMNRIIAPNAQPPAYPIRRTLDAIPFPSGPEAMWPAGALPAGAAANRTSSIEKVGTMLWRSEATIVGSDGHATVRTIEGRKDFRLVDIEPPAPMYSLFILNRDNQRLTFNNVGGSLYVNNSVPGDTTGTSSHEISGLIRVNFANGENGIPLDVRTSLLGSPMVGMRSPLDENDGPIKSMFRGTDVLLVLDSSSNMAMMGGETTCIAHFEHSARNPAAPLQDTFAAKRVALIDPDEQEEKNGLIQRQLDAVAVGNPEVRERLQRQYDQFAQRYERPTSTISDAERRFQSWYESHQQTFRYVSLLNFIPDVGALSVHPVRLLASLAQLALYGPAPVNSWTASTFLARNDCFVAWEMPYFGTEWRPFTIPVPPWNTGATYLFGAGAMHPTLTREVEGKVVKSYRQWKMCICGLQPLDALWIGGVRVPPIPIPIWYTGVIQNKYGYNFLPLQSFDASANDIYGKVKEYDPEEPGNGVPNLYSSLQYARKASLFFDTWQDFRTDLEKRVVQNASGQWVMPLHGITYVTGDLGTPQEYFQPRVPVGLASAGQPIRELWVTGRGMLVCSGNIYLNCSFRALSSASSEQASVTAPLFTMMARNGGLLLKNSAEGGQRFYRIDGSVYTDLGIMVPDNCSLRILGNWVTNRFPRAAMRGTTSIDYLSSRVRSSLGSLHPDHGRLDPSRYYGTLSPTWIAWQEK